MTCRRSARIVRDLSPKLRTILEQANVPCFSNRPLDKNREPFTAEEWEIANRIGTPEQAKFKKD